MTIGQRALRGTLWLSVANYATCAITFGTDLILARLLIPEDFGAVALAVSVLTIIVGQVGSLGLSAAIVQYEAENETDERRFLSTAFSVQLIVVFLVFALALILSVTMRWVYSADVLAILVLLSAGRGFQLLATVPSALVQKRMLFQQDALISFLSLTISSVIGILLAWQGFGFWSLVGKQLSQMLISGIGAWWVSRWSPRLAWDRGALNHVWRFARSMWIAGNSQMILQELDDTTVGTLAGTSALGYYSRAWKLSRLFMEFVAPAIGRTVLPTFSNLKGDSQALASVFGIVQRSIARMAALFFLGIGLLAPAAISVLYGKQWLPIVPLFRIMIIYGFLKSIFDQYAVLMISTDRPHILSRIRIAQLALFIPGVFIAAHLGGAMGVAVIVNLTIMLGTGLMVWQGKKLVKFSFLRTIVPSVGATLLTAGVVVVLQRFVQISTPLVEMFILGPFTAVCFGVWLFLLERRTLIRDIRRIQRAVFSETT